MDMHIELICLLALCDKTDCAKGHTNDKYLIVTPFISLLSRALGGNPADVPIDVRTKAFRTMEAILKHYAGDIPEVIVDLSFRGIADEDRSVRISAG